MVVSPSYHFTCFKEEGVDFVMRNPVGKGEGEVISKVESLSFNGRELECCCMNSIPGGGGEIEKITLPVFTQHCRNNLVSTPCSEKKIERISTTDAEGPKHAAALKLQKVYKSFRTRRKLADCAVLVEQSWWKLLDFAELKHSSVSFFDTGKNESAISRWSRARTRAAKVGKGLSQNDKAQKLALQHWLEAIDPRHRYGHNLHFYYDKWLQCQSEEPFFYWLDVGEGREINIVDKCHRSDLQQQCIKYLGPAERKAYEVVVVNGRFVYKMTDEVVHTIDESNDAKWIFVLSTYKNMYVGKKSKGTFQHSSFLAGGATSAAGRLVVDNGILKVVWPHSGHYRPTDENFQDFLSFLKDNNVNLSNVKMASIEDDPEFIDEEGALHLRNDSSDQLHIEDPLSEPPTSAAGTTEDAQEVPARPKIGGGTRGVGKVGTEEATTVEGTRWYQLGNKLAHTWTSGAGPRISCVRDYPSEVQTLALEEVSLSPRSSPHWLRTSPRVPGPTAFSREAGRSSSDSGPVHHPPPQSPQKKEDLWHFYSTVFSDQGGGGRRGWCMS